MSRLAGRLAPPTTWQERARGVEIGGGVSPTTHLLHIDPAAVEAGGPAYLRKPTAYSVWQKEPWDAGTPATRAGWGDATGVDFLAAYWLGRAHGFIAAR